MKSSMMEIPRETELQHQFFFCFEMEKSIGAHSSNRLNYVLYPAIGNSGELCQLNNFPAKDEKC